VGRTVGHRPKPKIKMRASATSTTRRGSGLACLFAGAQNLVRARGDMSHPALRGHGRKRKLDTATGLISLASPGVIIFLVEGSL